MEENRSNASETGVAHASAFGWAIFFWAASITGAISALCVVSGPPGVARITLGILAIICWLVALVAKRKAAHLPQYPIGQCGVCGYDLRATPERCPECGAAPSDWNPPEPKPAPPYIAKAALVLCFCVAAAAIAVAWKGPAIPALRFAAVMVALISAVGAVIAVWSMPLRRPQ